MTSGRGRLTRLSASFNYHTGFEEPILPLQLRGRVEILMQKGSLCAGLALPLVTCSDGPSLCLCSQLGEPMS